MNTNPLTPHLRAKLEEWRKKAKTAYDTSAPRFDRAREHYGEWYAYCDCIRSIEALLAAHEAATPAAEWTALDGSLTIRFLQYINAKRAVRWHQNGGIKSWSALEWAGAMAGEAGEACNAAKKLKRIEDQIANINLEEGRSLTDEQNASSQVVDEIADTVIYGVVLAERVGLDLEEAIRMKFNRKSEEYGFPERIPPNQPPASAEAAPVERPELGHVLADVLKHQGVCPECHMRVGDGQKHGVSQVVYGDCRIGALLPALPPSTERTP